MRFDNNYSRYLNKRTYPLYKVSVITICSLIVQASENVGCVMIFTLVSAVQEFLLQLVDDIKQGVEEEKKRVRDEQRRLEDLKVRKQNETRHP